MSLTLSTLLGLAFGLPTFLTLWSDHTSNKGEK